MNQEVVKFNPRKTKTKLAGDKAAIEQAHKLESDGSFFQEAAEAYAEEQAHFVEWWGENVSPGESPGTNQYSSVAAVQPTSIPVDHAEALTGISKFQVSRWRTRLERGADYIDYLCKRLVRVAFAGHGTHAPTITPVLPAGKFGAIYADPPWHYEGGASGKGTWGASENHYPTMTQEQIEALPIKDLAADDCALFMWAVFPLLPQALKVIEAWGFDYKTCAFVWIKQTKDEQRFATGMGNWTRANAELCLLGTRGAPHRQAADVHQVIMAKRQSHSSKPEEAAERIERLVPGPYIELFSRAPREGWDSWGSECENQIST